MNPMQEWKAFCRLHECLPLSGRAVALWMELAWCDNCVFWSSRFTASDALLKDRLDVSQSTLIRARTELIRAGLLTAKKQRNGALIYHLPLPSERFAAWLAENTDGCGSDAPTVPLEDTEDTLTAPAKAEATVTPEEAALQTDMPAPIPDDSSPYAQKRTEKCAQSPTPQDTQAPSETLVTQGATPLMSTGMTTPVTTGTTPPVTTPVTSASYYYKNKNKNINQNKNKESAPAHPKGWRKDTLCFGEFHNVFLTPDEKERLNDTYPSLFPALLEEFSSALAARDYRYINHYAALCRWAVRRTDDTPKTPKNATFSAVSQRQDYDIEAIRRRDIEQNMALFMKAQEEAALSA